MDKSLALSPQTLDEIDFFDLDMFTKGDPHAAWSLLRKEAPVWWHDREGGEKFWCVTGYDDTRSVLGDAHLFSSARPGVVLLDNIALEAPSFPMEARPMIHQDPPLHLPRRKVIRHRFTPPSIARLEEQLRRYTINCLEEVADKREVDFVTEVAHRIPAAIALSLMGVPEADWDRMAELEHLSVTGGSDPEFTGAQERTDAYAAAATEIFMYFYQLAERRKAEPGDDLISQLVHGEVDGEPMAIGNVVADAILLLAGGLDTTRAAASGGAMLPLMQNPDQLRLLQEDPSRLVTGVDEFVRWASPIVHEARAVTADTELHGVALREGDRIAVWSPSANRDEHYFDDPFRFDVTRPATRHLGFAHGEHFCLGVHLARLTLRVEFSEILARFGSFELTGEPVRVRSNFVGGLTHLPMRMNPR
jgi:cholest-4-en-3-one 26-monooxygenase